MAKASYTFRALDREGAVLLQSRGRDGALTRVIGELYRYRGAVKAGSGYLHGNPATFGDISVDGVVRALGPTAYLMNPDEEVERLDRFGVDRVAAMNAWVNDEAGARSVVA